VATEPIDEAYVEIKPDLKDFDKEVKRELDGSFNRIEDKLDDLIDTIEKGFDRLVVALDANFSELQHIAKDTFDEIQDFARGAGRSIATDIEVGTKIAKHEIDDLADDAKHDFNRIERSARGSGFSIMGIFSKMGSSVLNVFSNIGESASNVGSKIGSSLGSTIGQVGSSLGTVTGSIGSIGQFALMATLIPAAIGLASALSQLVGILAALPAAAGVAVAAIAPLILAFHGFADAVGAVISGDPKKIDEALKGLSPSARSVAKEFQGLVKPFKDLQKVTQEALFKPLVGVLTQLANAVLPSLRAGLPIVASAFGNMFAQMGKLFANAETAGVFNQVFATTARIVQAFTPVLVHLVDVVSNLFVTGLPYVERFFGVIAKGIDAFATWLEKAQDGGKVTGWLEKAWDVGKKAVEVLKQLGIFAATLLNSFSDEGTDTLNGLGDALKKVNDYLKSSDGAETLHNLGVMIHWAGNAIVFLVESTTTAYKALNAFFDFVRGIGPFFVKLGNWIKDAWNSAVDWTVNAWHNIEDFVVGVWNGIINFFKNTGTSIGSFFSNLWTSIVNGVHNIVATIMAFPGALKQYLIDAIHQAAYNFGYAIGMIVKFFMDLPSNIAAAWQAFQDAIRTGVHAVIDFFTQTIPALAVSVGDWFMDMKNRAVNAVSNWVSEVINWASQLPGRVSNYVQDMKNRVTNAISDMWHNAVNFFKNLVKDVSDEAHKLPGQITDALSSLYDKAYNLGRDIVRGIVNGMKSLGGWLKDQAADLAREAWQGAKDAIGAKSPSRKFMQLGKWSSEGFAIGFDQYDLSGHLASSMKDITTDFGKSSTTLQPQNTQVSVGGAQLTAYLSVDGGQFHPVVVQAMYDNAQDVALAAEQGGTDLARRR
jgi:phage-related protein